MDAGNEKHAATMERTTERELVITRNVNGPARLVFEAWTNPELFRQWWIPKSFGLSVLSFDADIRTGGQYRLVMKHGDAEPMAFFGKYLEVTPHSRIVWTNEEAEGGGPVSTVTFEEKGDRTRMVMHELYPSKEALDAAISSGEKSCMDETFDQLDEMLAGLGATVG
jgi:uncharacterized protein YndB with AHSA1/START domain